MEYIQIQEEIEKTKVGKSTAPSGGLKTIINETDPIQKNNFMEVLSNMATPKSMNKPIIASQNYEQK